MTLTDALQVLETKDRFILRCFATCNFYGTGKPKFETGMLEDGAMCSNGIKYNNIWFETALSSLLMKSKCMMRPQSDIFILT